MRPSVHGPRAAIVGRVVPFQPVILPPSDALGTMTVEAWLRDLADGDVPLVGLVRAALRNDLVEADEAPFGIVILHTFRSDSLRQIRALTQNARIIVLLEIGRAHV